MSQEMQTVQTTHWSKIAERGSLLGMRIVAWCFRVFGYRLAWLLLLPITAYFFCTGKAVRRASYAFLQRATNAPHVSAWQVFRHMLAFSEAALDRVSVWLGRLPRPVEFPQRDILEQQLESGRGAVLISAHLGNLEMSRALAHMRGIRGINAVVFTEHAQRYTRFIAGLNPDSQVNLIAVSSMGADTAMMLKDKVDAGELVVIVADRTPPAQNGRTQRAMFLGQEADFPIGPFVLAALLECPAYLFFCLREKKQYRIYLERFAQSIQLPRATRQAQLQQYVARYAERLGYYCQQAPTQWFNFFDFWQLDVKHE